MQTKTQLSERNQRILDRYADGATLQEIGAEVGITREGVRLIVVKYGGADAEASRAAREVAKEAIASQARATFITSFREIASDLAHQGFTRSETISRMKVLFPAIDVDVADDALKT